MISKREHVPCGDKTPAVTSRRVSRPSAGRGGSRSRSGESERERGLSRKERDEKQKKKRGKKLKTSLKNGFVYVMRVTLRPPSTAAVCIIRRRITDKTWQRAAGDKLLRGSKAITKTIHTTAAVDVALLVGGLLSGHRLIPPNVRAHCI